MHELRRRGIGRWRHLKRSRKGISLLETVVALGILGLVGVAFMGALTTTFTATEISEKKVTAENLIRTQLEYMLPCCSSLQSQWQGEPATPPSPNGLFTKSENSCVTLSEAEGPILSDSRQSRRSGEMGAFC